MSRGAALVIVIGIAIAPACRNIDPNKGMFSCASTKDCGSGFECRTRFDGVGRCFLVGVCKDEELCNGVDDTCDGQVDEGFDLTTDVANCGACGRTCAGGTLCRASTCVEGRCDDAVDNDSNGKTDCDDAVCFGFDCDTTMAPASRCGLALVSPDGGAGDAGITADGGLDAGGDDGGLVRGCFRPETTCGNGFDDDGDGLADCADSDCDNQACFSGQSCSMGTCPGPG
jgi:hypothetical protein